MDTETMIAELRHLEEKHKKDRVYTFDTNWSLLCYDVANRLEELVKELEVTREAKNDLYEECMRITSGTSTDIFINERLLRTQLDSMYMPKSESVFDYNSGYNSAIDDIFSYLNRDDET